MRKLIISNAGLLITFAFLFILGVLVSAIYGRTETHIFINRFHTSFFDLLMKTWTYMGDGVVMLGISVLLFFKKIRYGLTLLSSFILSSLIVQLLKRLIFEGIPRPVKFFEGSGFDLHLVPDIKYYLSNSFPSGHSATAFALLFGLAFLCENRFLKALLFIFATGAAFSRVYLSQHFLVDAVFGSFIGVLCAMISHWYFCYIDKEWLNVPVYKLIDKDKK